MSDAHILTTENLVMQFGRGVAVDHVDFALREGELRCLLGPNGAGKSTVFKCLTGQLTPTSGTVKFRGKDITGWNTHDIVKEGVGIKTQVPNLFNGISVCENVRIAARRKHLTSMARDKAEEMMEKCGVAHLATREVGLLALFQRLTRLLDRADGALSGGEQQLLALARCLCRRPKLMLLDQPTEGVQPSIIDEISDTLKQLTKASDITIVQVEQNLDFITGLSDRVYAISGGVLDREIPKEPLTDSRAVSEFTGFAA